MLSFSARSNWRKTMPRRGQALGHAYAVSGNRAGAQKVLDQLKELSAHGWVAPYNAAVIYAGLGEKDQAFALLEQAYKGRSYFLAQSICPRMNA